MAECRNSGRSIVRWYAENRIKPETYYNWRKKVFKAMVEQQESPTFTQLKTLKRRGNLAATAGGLQELRENGISIPVVKTPVVSDNYLKYVYDELNRELLGHNFLHADEKILQILYRLDKESRA